MTHQRHISSDPQTAAEAAGARIFTLLTEALAKRDTANLAISGGSTPKLMFQSMAKQNFDWSRVHLYFVDERAVPPTDDLSNYKLAHENLIAPANIPAANVHRIQGELDPHQAAAQYAAELEAIPHFDIIHQGTGPDAHTASLFPGDPLIDDRTGRAAATYSESKGNWRITLLPAVLLAAEHTLFLVSGTDKAEALKKIFEAPFDPHQYPAQLIARQARQVEWFLDQAAFPGAR